MLRSSVHSGLQGTYTPSNDKLGNDTVEFSVVVSVAASSGTLQPPTTSQVVGIMEKELEWTYLNTTAFMMQGSWKFYLGVHDAGVVEVGA